MVASKAGAAASVPRGGSSPAGAVEMTRPSALTA